MDDPTTSVIVMKEFFGGDSEPHSDRFPPRPVTNRELLTLRHEDPKGYDWVAEQCAAFFGVGLTVPGAVADPTKVKVDIEYAAA